MPTTSVSVGWLTAERSAHFPEDEVFARVDYDIAVDRFPGYTSNVRVFVEGTSGPSQICVVLEGHELVPDNYGDDWVDEYTELTAPACATVELDDKDPRVELPLVLLPGA